MAMKRLSKKWRKPRGGEGFSLPTRDNPSLDDARPMDTQEQEELVRSFEKGQALQSLCWRSVFAAFLFCFAAFLVYSIYQQAMSPWELRHYAYFMEEAPSWMIIFADWIAVLACSMAIVGLIQNTRQHRRWLWYSCFTSIIPAMFWLYYLSSGALYTSLTYYSKLSDCEDESDGFAPEFQDFAGMFYGSRWDLLAELASVYMWITYCMNHQKKCENLEATCILIKLAEQLKITGPSH